MKNSYLIAGITLKHLFRLLGRNKISYNPKVLFRLFFIFQSAVWSSIFSYFDKKKVDKKILAGSKIPGPIFIIGHWRTGTTLLHKILSLDPDLTAPTLFQVAIPFGYLSSHQFYKPIMQLMVTKYRPMDMVRIGMDEPQEDEYAFFRMTDFSPLERLIFPESGEYFLMNCKNFVPEGDKRSEWDNAVTYFFKKLHVYTGKTIVSKNPFNSLRINELRQLFSDSSFIHIYRHPFNVIPSTINMFDIVQAQNCMNKNKSRPDINEVIKVFDHFMTVIRQDLESVPRNKYYEIKFEEFESDPVGSLKAMYKHLGIIYSGEFEKNVKDFLYETSDYQKNKFDLSDEEKKLILTSLEHHLKYYHYI